MKKLLCLALVPLMAMGAAAPDWNAYAQNLRKQAADMLSKYSKYDFAQLQKSKTEINTAIQTLENKIVEGIGQKKVKAADVRSVLNSIAKLRGHEFKQAQKAKISKDAYTNLRKTRGVEVRRLNDALFKAYRGLPAGQQYKAEDQYVPSDNDEAQVNLEAAEKPAFADAAYKALGKSSDASAYEILGVSENASQVDVRNAWKKLTRQWHPDLNADKNTASEVIKLINWAHSQLVTE